MLMGYYRELDVLMLGAVMPKYCSVTAKRSLSYVPFLGWFSTSSLFSIGDPSNVSTSDALQNRLHRPRQPRHRTRRLRQHRKANAARATLRLHFPRRHTIIYREARNATLQERSVPLGSTSAGPYCTNRSGELCACIQYAGEVIQERRY